MAPLEARRGPELVVALAGAVGTDTKHVLEVLTEEFRQVGYTSCEVRLSRILNEVPEIPGFSRQLRDTYGSEYERIRDYMDAGSELRKSTGRGDIFALLAVSKIRSLRQAATGDVSEPADRVVYIINSLKHPEEANTLRDIYGRAFSQISIFSTRDRRIETLTKMIRDSSPAMGTNYSEAKAVELINRDEYEGIRLGQRFSDVFPLGDLFVDNDSRATLAAQTRRYVELLFGHPFHTPTMYEYGMYHAYSASLRSADLSRQVGAAIFRFDGDIVSVGCNEVPRSGGGQYWADDPSDSRDFQLGYDSNAKYRQNLLADFVERLKAASWLAGGMKAEGTAELVSKLNEDDGVLEGSQIKSILEFGRAVHAEMAAISAAAKIGLSISGGKLFCTTFPCHLCARHIVAAGIEEVFFIEPYPKSLVSELYQDSVVVEPSEVGSRKVRFMPFVGVAPRSYQYLFAPLGDRKDSSGDSAIWRASEAEPKVRRYVLSYLFIEEDTLVMIPNLIPSLTRSGDPSG
ncbi:MAG: anti-phage dCTP deaminase [bacterium]